MRIVHVISVLSSLQYIHCTKWRLRHHTFAVLTRSTAVVFVCENSIPGSTDEANGIFDFSSTLLLMKYVRAAL
jgi:hypothetical protein